jgi:hypothetical protein
MASDAATSVQCTPATTNRTRQAIIRWRRMQAFGGFVLACTFFLPAVDSCNSPIIPFQGVWEFTQDLPDDPGEWLGLPAFLATFLEAYLFGLLVVIAILWQRTARPAHARRVEWIGSCMILLAAFAVLLLFVAEIVTSPIASWWPPDWGEIVFLALAIITPAYWIRCMRHGAGGRLSLRWYTSLCCILWFTAWTLSGALYGLHLSLLGSAVIFIGAFEEARLRSNQDRFDSLRALLTATLRVHDDDPTVCSRCGYPLHGLTAPRCPECGTAFPPDRLDSLAAPVA